MYYTLGQRKGLGIGGFKDGDEEPWYVVDKNITNNILIVAQGHNHPAMFHNVLETGSINWISETKPKVSEINKKLTAKIRYRQKDQPCQLTIIDENKTIVRFEQPQRAITPGQSIVLYQDEVCLGGGIIETMYRE